jgi:hypothetical protein
MIQWRKPERPCSSARRRAGAGSRPRHHPAALCLSEGRAGVVQGKRDAEITRSPPAAGDLTGAFSARMGLGGVGLKRDGKADVHLGASSSGGVSRLEVIGGMSVPRHGKPPFLLATQGAS